MIPPRNTNSVFFPSIILVLPIGKTEIGLAVSIVEVAEKQEDPI